MTEREKPNTLAAMKPKRDQATRKWTTISVVGGGFAVAGLVLDDIWVPVAVLFVILVLGLFEEWEKAKDAKGNERAATQVEHPAP